MYKYDISKQIEIIKKAIINEVQVKFIYLFGSYAYGKPNKNSDIDIYVIIPDNNDICLFDIYGNIITYLYDNNVLNAEILFEKESDFKCNKELYSFQDTIYKKGTIVYENK